METMSPILLDSCFQKDCNTHIPVSVLVFVVTWLHPLAADMRKPVDQKLSLAMGYSGFLATTDSEGRMIDLSLQTQYMAETTAQISVKIKNTY